MVFVSRKPENRFEPLKAMMGAWSNRDMLGDVTPVVIHDIDIHDF